MEFCGSSGACDRSGKTYSASTTLAAVLNAASASPISAVPCGPGRGRLRRLRRELLGLRRIADAALRRHRAFVPHDLQRPARVVRLPPAVGDDRDAGGQEVVAPPGDRVDDERVLDARQPLHLVEVGADGLAAKHRTLVEDREERTRRLDVDAERRLAGHDVGVVDALDRLADDLEVLRILVGGLDGLDRGRRHRRDARRQRRVGRLATGGRVRDDAASRRQFTGRHVPMLRGGGHHHQPAAGANLPHRIVVDGNGAAAAFGLRPVLRIEIGLLDLDLAPVDVELVGDDLRQGGPDALSRLRVLRDDREGVVGVDGDVGTGRERPL